MGVIIFLIVLVVILILGIKIVPQQHAYVIERLGKYKKTITAGGLRELNTILPWQIISVSITSAVLTLTGQFPMVQKTP